MYSYPTPLYDHLLFTAVMCGILVALEINFQKTHIYSCLSGVPYESYKGFHEWRYLRMKTIYTMKYIMGVVEKVPGLLEALGKLKKRRC